MPPDLSLFILTLLYSFHNPSSARKLEEFITCRVVRLWVLKLGLYLELDLISL